MNIAFAWEQFDNFREELDKIREASKGSMNINTYTTAFDNCITLVHNCYIEDKSEASRLVAQIKNKQQRVRYGSVDSMFDSLADSVHTICRDLELKALKFQADERIRREQLPPAEDYAKAIKERNDANNTILQLTELLNGETRKYEETHENFERVNNIALEYGKKNHELATERDNLKELLRKAEQDNFQTTLTTISQREEIDGLNRQMEALTGIGDLYTAARTQNEVLEKRVVVLRRIIALVFAGILSVIILATYLYADFINPWLAGITEVVVLLASYITFKGGIPGAGPKIKAWFAKNGNDIIVRTLASILAGSFLAGLGWLLNKALS